LAKSDAWRFGANNKRSQRETKRRKKKRVLKSLVISGNGYISKEHFAYAGLLKGRTDAYQSLIATLERFSNIVVKLKTKVISQSQQEQTTK